MKSKHLEVAETIIKARCKVDKLDKRYLSELLLIEGILEDAYGKEKTDRDSRHTVVLLTIGTLENKRLQQRRDNCKECNN